MKVSEAVLEIKNKVVKTLLLIQNIDSNMKILMNRINTLTKSVNHLNDLINVEIPLPDPTAKSIEGPVIQQSLLGTEGLRKLEEISSNKDLSNKGPSDDKFFIGRPMMQDSDDNSLEEAMVHKGNRRGARVATPDDIRVPVSQFVKFSDGNNASSASVEIFNMSDKKLIKQVRTNKNGRWCVPLNPGDYSVHVSKRINSSNRNKPVELKYNIRVPNSSEPVEIPDSEFLVGEST